MERIKRTGIHRNMQCVLEEKKVVENAQKMAKLKEMEKEKENKNAKKSKQVDKRERRVTKTKINGQRR